MPITSVDLLLDSPPLPITKVWLMGSWQIQQDGTSIEIPTGQPRALLIYLLLQPDHSARRATLIEELWPTSPPNRARRHLTDALYRLRRALSSTRLWADGEQIGLAEPSTWWVDLWAFRDELANLDAATLVTRLSDYAQPIAPEISEHWILPYRLQWQEQYWQAAFQVANEAIRQAETAQAETIFRQLVAVDSLAEAAHRGLMLSLAQQGRLADALQQYEQLVSLLAQELAVPPSDETRALANQLYSELELLRHQAQNPPTPRLIGRAHERTTLLTTLDRARAGQAGLVILLGEPGMGKTTLLRDLAAAADWRGWQVCWGHAQEGVTPAPYAPLSMAIQEALPAPRVGQLSTSLPPIWFNLLSRLLPTLQQTQPQHTAHLPAAAYAAKDLPQALEQLLNSLQEIAPLLLLLDDVQWGDPAQWSLLTQLVPLLHHQRILIVLSGRLESLRQQSATWQTIEAWDRAGLAQVLALQGLSSDELGELIAAQSGPTASSPSTYSAETLQRASAGNPLFALELLVAGGPDQFVHTRPTLRSLFKQRLAHLRGPERQALEIAAILGVEVDYADWEALWQDENPFGGPLAPLAAALETAQWVRIERHAYRFIHDFLHAAVLADLDEQMRQRHHRVALTFLTTRSQTANTPVDAVQLLYHAEGAGEAAAIVQYAQQLGERALAAFTFASAAAHFTRVLAQLPLAELADEEPGWQFQALLGRIQAYHFLGQRREEAADLATIATLPVTPEQQVQILIRQAGHQLVIGELIAAQQTIDTGLALAHACASPQLGEMQLIAGRIARDRNQLLVAQEYGQQAYQRYQQMGEQWGMAFAEDFLGGLAWDQGDYETAAVRHEQAAEIFAALGDMAREAQSLNNLGSTYWELGQYDAARRTHERSIIVCRELGNRLSEGDNIDNLGGVAWVLGDYSLAIRQYRAALTLREQIDDQWGVAISLSNLGSAYRMQGMPHQALSFYERSLPICRQIGRKRNEAYVLHGLGETMLDLGRADEAWDYLQQALAMRAEIGDRLRLLETHSALIHVALARQDRQHALSHAAAIQELLQPTDRAALRQDAYFACFALADQMADPAANRWLALAHQAQAEILKPLAASDRAHFLHHVPLNRKLADAIERYTISQQVQFMRDQQPVTLTWSLVKPEDHLIENPAERRRHVLTRLMAEAAAQHITPTHDQLASALGVSRRTILRDLA